MVLRSYIFLVFSITLLFYNCSEKEQNNKKQFELYEQKIESLEKQLNVFKLISSSKNTDKEISINSIKFVNEPLPIKVLITSK